MLKSKANSSDSAKRRPLAKRKPRQPRVSSPVTGRDRSAGGTGDPNANCHGYMGGVKGHGKDVLSNPQVAVVYWGVYYQSHPNAPALLDKFFNDVFASSHFDALTEYGIARPIFYGSVVVTGDIFQKNGGLENQLQTWVSNILIPDPLTAGEAKNWLYVILPPPGETLHIGNLTSATDICGYHDSVDLTFGRDFGDTSNSPTWTGDFLNTGSSQILLYLSNGGNWWLGSYDNGSQRLRWSLVSQTRISKGFDLGDTSQTPTWVGDFAGVGSAQVLTFGTKPKQWYLGTLGAGQTAVSWMPLSTPSGQPSNNAGALNDAPSWIGAFSVTGATEVLVYLSTKGGQWWLGSVDAANAAINWTMVWQSQGQTAIELGEPSKQLAWAGAFRGNLTDILLYVPKTQRWWWGAYNAGAGTLDWLDVTGQASPGIGNVSEVSAIVGNFASTGTEQLLIQIKGGQWWLAGIDSDFRLLDWSQVSWTRNAAGTDFGDTLGSPLWRARLTAGNQHQALLYLAKGGNWWLGTLDPMSSQLVWEDTSQTRVPHVLDFGDTARAPTFIADFIGGSADQILLYLSNKGHWWFAQAVAPPSYLAWELIGVTRPFNANTAYAIVAVPENPGSPNSLLNGVTACLSHELAEAFSNPRRNGFYSDKNGCEIGDICETNQLVTVAGYSLQQYWSQAQRACIPPPP